MLRKFFGVLAALAMVASVQAGPLTSHLSTDGIPDVLDDDSVSFIVDLDGDMAISVGDIVSGVLRIGTTSANGVLDPTDQLVGVFSFQVRTSVGAPGPQVDLTNGGVDPTLGTGLSIKEILDAAGIANPLVDDGLLVPDGDDAPMIAVLSSDPNPVDITTVGPAGLPAALSAYSLDAILGFGNAADYLEVRSFLDADDSGEVDFAELPAGFGGFIGQESGGLSVLHQASNLIFLPVASLHTDGATTTFHDVDLQGTLFGPRLNTPAGYQITDSTFLTVNAVPEPGSMAVWGMLIGVGAVAYRRRNKKAAA